MVEATMTIQSTIQIGQVIRDGVVFDVKNWLGDGMRSDSLMQSVQDLFAILAGRKIDYVLVGGIALLHYVEGRNTQDVDLLMASPALKQLPELEIMDQDSSFVHATYGELQIDILLSENPLFQIVHREYVEVQAFLDQKIPLATVPGLVLMKLYALPSLYRQGNFAKVGIYENDIATLMYYYQPDLMKIKEDLSSVLSESDFVEINTILGDIEKRVQRFKRGDS
jgi:hypothetical protein